MVMGGNYNEKRLWQVLQGEEELNLSIINDCTGSKICLPIGITGGGGEENSDIIGIGGRLGICKFLSLSSDSYMQQSLRTT